MGFFNGEITEDGYRPSFLERLLTPRTSGNTVNGLGEDEPRQPSRVYHFAPVTTRFPHFWVNVLFLIKSSRSKPQVPHLKRALKHDKAAKETKPVTTAPVSRSPEEWTKQIKEFALNNGAVEVGITRTNPLWVYEGAEPPGEWLIMMGFLMDHSELKKAPEEDAGAEVMRVYGNGAEAAEKLSDWIRDQGHQATGGCLVPSSLVLIPAAIEAGLGELGKHGSLINRKHGATLRLAYVAVDFPLVPDKPDSFLLDDFCSQCQVCTNNCPPNAITDKKQTVRGVERWYVNFDKCVPYFNDNTGCGICIATCPWSLPERAPIMVDKLQLQDKRKQIGRESILASV